MTTQSLTPQEKKLKNLRRILWTVFISIAVLSLLCVSTSIPVYSLVRAQGFPDGSYITPVVLIMLMGISVLLAIGAVGVVCLVIYWIYKARIEKDEDMFP
jgi:ABC-type Fe3+ transport system permease subunit